MYRNYIVYIIIMIFCYKQTITKSDEIMTS